MCVRYLYVKSLDYSRIIFKCERDLSLEKANKHQLFFLMAFGIQSTHQAIGFYL